MVGMLAPHFERDSLVLFQEIMLRGSDYQNVSKFKLILVDIFSNSASSRNLKIICLYIPENKNLVNYHKITN